MPSSKPQKGINHLEIVFPEIAKEADGWGPASITFASGAVKALKCEEHGHSWEVSISQRSGIEAEVVLTAEGKRSGLVSMI